MTEHRTGTREDWLAARRELLDAEKAHMREGDALARRRQELPWVPIGKEYVFETDDGRKTLAELFDGRSQLLVCHFMFGFGFRVDEQNPGCTGCSLIADHFDGAIPHLNGHDVTLVAESIAPLEELHPYKERMGWRFPYVSTYDTDFPWDFGLALTEEQAEQIPEVRQMLENPPEWLAFWASQVGAELKDGIRENPSYIAFAKENGTVYHTYTVSAPDPFVAPFFNFLLDRTPKKPWDEPLNYRKDEYPA